MLSHEITKEERDKMLKYREMILSSDEESIKLGMALANEEFGKYYLWPKDSPSFNQIFNMTKYTKKHILDGILPWLYFAAHSKAYLYYEGDISVE